jgi:hypothetical protein
MSEPKNSEPPAFLMSQAHPHADNLHRRGLVASAHQGPRVHVINRIITCITDRKPEPARMDKMPAG